MLERARGRYGNLYQVRRNGGQPQVVGELHLKRNGREAFENIRALYLDPEYHGDNPQYWLASGKVFAATWSREKLEAHHEAEVYALRFREDAAQTSLDAAFNGRPGTGVRSPCLFGHFFHG